MYKVYLIGFIDDHSRYIVADGLFRHQTSEAVMEVLRDGIGQWGAPREILSDNGRQYASWKGKTQFQKTLRREGIQHVRSAPHHPMTLGKIERFWKTIWTEFLEDAVFASFANARQRIDHWIGYYNHQRPHQGIGGACPADRFYGIAGDVEAALAQGCKENALQLALGQETSPPLYLLGKLGDTDVRVTRKGDEIEMRLGDTVHETIKMGVPFQIIDEEKDDDALEEHDGRGTLSSAGAGEGWQEAGEGDLCDLRSEQTDAVPDAGESRESGDGSVGAEEDGAQTEERGGPADYRVLRTNAFLEGEKEQWKTRYDIAQAYINLMREHEEDAEEVEQEKKTRETGASLRARKTCSLELIVRHLLMQKRKENHWSEAGVALVCGIKVSSLRKWNNEKEIAKNKQKKKRGRPEAIAPEARWKLQKRYQDHYTKVLQCWAKRQRLGTYAADTIARVIADLKPPPEKKPKPIRYEIAAPMVMWSEDGTGFKDGNRKREAMILQDECARFKLLTRLADGPANENDVLTYLEETFQ